LRLLIAGTYYENGYLELKNIVKMMSISRIFISTLVSYGVAR